MKRFTDLMSPLSWLLQIVACTVSILILFKPSLREFLIMLAVDTMALAIALPLEKRLFLRCNPGAARFFPEPDFAKIATYGAAEKLALFEELSAFPKKRAAHCYWFNYLKILPGCLIILFWWERSIPFLGQLALLAGYILILMLFFHGAIYLELHQFVSNKITEFHGRFDLSEAFRVTPPETREGDYLKWQELTLLGIVGLVFFLQIIVLQVSSGLTAPQKEATLLGIGVIGLALAWRIWSLGRIYLTNAMAVISRHFETLDIHGGPQATIALHSSNFLARFERTFNALVQRLKASEEETARWHLTEIEQSRFRALGEISGLIAHDLSTPLHVIQFCATEIKERPDGPRIPKYVDNLITNTSRAIDLVNSIKAFLKNPVPTKNEVIFGQAHGYVLRLLSTQFSQTEYPEVRFELSPELSPLSLALARSDLIHILYNIYKNSIENFLAHAIPDPTVALKLKRTFDGKAEISIRDNGTGLGPEEFERMTAYKVGAASDPIMTGSLGLRLVRRLVERYSGSLSLVPNSEVTGTEYSLILSHL